MELIKRDKLLVLTVLASMLLLISRDILLLNIPTIALVLLWSFVMLKLKYESLVPFLFFLFPLSCGIPGYVFLISYFILILKGPALKHSQIIPLFVIGLLEVFSDMFNSIPGSISGALSYLSFTAIFFYFICGDNKKVEMPRCVLYYCVGTLFTMFIVVYNLLSQYGIELVLTGALRSGALGVIDNDVSEMSGHLAMNANTLAYYAISVVSILLVTVNKYTLPRWIIVSAIFISLLLGLLSFSRTYIACVILLFTLYSCMGKSANKTRLLLIAVVFATILTVIFPEYINSIIDSFLVRGQDDDLKTAGGRTDLFSFYNKAWSKDFMYVLFGTGVFSSWSVLSAPNAMHNGLQQIWVSLGVIGFFVYTLYITRYIKLLFRNDYRILLIIPFVVTFLFDQSLQFLNPYPLVLPVLATLMTLRFKDYNTHEYEKNSI